MTKHYCDSQIIWTNFDVSDIPVLTYNIGTLKSMVKIFEKCLWKNDFQEFY